MKQLNPSMEVRRPLSKAPPVLAMCHKMEAVPCLRYSAHCPLNEVDNMGLHVNHGG